jgi:Zn-dependent protease
MAMSDLPELLLRFFVLAVSLSFHEAAHAWSAFRLGDDTAARLGRLSLNPLVHLDPLGSLMILSGMPLGWAKPVPVNAANLANPRTGMPMVSFAGPLSNIILGILGCVVFYFVGYEISPMSGWWAMLQLFITINFALAVFNLLPIFPLDGSNVITAFMSDATARRYEEKVAALGPFPLIFIVGFEFMPGPGVLQVWFNIWNPLFAPILALFGVPRGFLPYM